MERLLPEFTPEQRLQLVAEARSLLTARNGLPVTFRHQGRTLRGLDCIGTIVWSVRRLGFEVQDRIDYGRMPADRKLVETFRLHLGAPVGGPAQPGDIVTMSWGVAGEAHAAMVGDHPHGLSLIHSACSIGRVIEHRLTDEHMRLVTNIFRP